ncbi:type III secretion system stator protein SctL [Burkholderia pyrrocinia]|uniref:type III secretion system stator protein SctL n=1 Tax=Burkholderia sp. IT-111MI5 TaxID=3026439 RepID=UPI002A3019AB|nr:type III secretion system stator protein SctL [Burkholderia pyrrocinia]EKS9894690.1 type III secretion system stator protein SctL [Burkholderia pyrrocinia]EKS9906983.1 type III secretion system stator protein SctL [Burkholderia pyrrocinia]
MIIWLRQPGTEQAARACNTGVGVHADVVQREALASLVQLDAGYLALQRQHAEVLAQAARDADSMLAAARADADALRAEARGEYDTAQQRGYDAGSRDALSQWYARTAQLLERRYELQMSLKQRIAGLVVSAVEKIVANEQPAALFARAGDVVERIIEGSRTLQVRVHPDEHDAAVETFSHAVAQWRARGQPVQLTVHADRTLDPGACVCDTDIGSVDASLKVQIDAVRMAADAALRRDANAPDVPETLAPEAFAEVRTHAAAPGLPEPPEPEPEPASGTGPAEDIGVRA